MNGSVMPVSGMSFRLPAAMMNAWTPTTRARPAARSDRKSSPADGADPQTALDDHEIDPEDRHDPDQAELLAERGSGKSVSIGRDRPSAGPPPRPVPSSPPRAKA